MKEILKTIYLDYHSSKNDDLLDRNLDIFLDYFSGDYITFDDLAKKYNITRERVRQIVYKLVRLLGIFMKAQHLQIEELKKLLDQNLRNTK